MKLSNSKIKIFLIFSQKSPPHFSVQAKKKKKKVKKCTPKKTLFLSRNRNS